MTWSSRATNPTLSHGLRLLGHEAEEYIPGGIGDKFRINIIDLHLFAELVRLDEKDEQPFLDDRISNYFYPSVKCIYAMMDDLRSGDYHKLEQEAFELRSLASSLAVVRVAQLCSFIENKCRSGINERDHIEIDSTLRVMELANQFAQDWLVKELYARRERRR
ncbi:hypothetical protein PGTUg99_008733 [Puccinia graminis f. sp. tritici]|nr:hypothetical protein PGTUg99_008733 [Puccinia graminis f. sp. tritici]